jgi:hypothetical protein
LLSGSNLPVGLLVFFLVGAYLWTYARTIHALGDEGLTLYPAERILQGQIPYKHFFSELAPGSFYIQALWFKLFGISLMSARIPMLVTLALIGWQIFRISRLWLPPWAAGIPVLIYVVTAFSRWVVVSHHWYSLLFALSALILLVRYLMEGASWRSFLAGLCTCASALCMQSKGAFILMAGLLVLFLEAFYSDRSRGNSRWRALGLYLLGVAALLIPVLMYFHHTDALADLADNTFLHLWRNYLPYEHQPLPFLPATLLALLRKLAADFSLLQLGKSVSILLWSLVIPIGALALLWANRLEAPKIRPLVFWACFLFGAGLMLSEMHRFDFIHMLFGAPVLLILAVAALYWASEWRVWGIRATSGVLVLLAVFYVGNGGSQMWRERRRNAEVYTRRGVFYQTPERARHYQAMITSIESLVRPGDQVLCYPYASMLYFLTATRNPTRFEHLLPGWATSAQFAEVRRMLESEKSPLFVFSNWRESRHSFPEIFPTVPPALFQDHPIERFLACETTLFRPVREEPRFVMFKKEIPGPSVPTEK